MARTQAQIDAYNASHPIFAEDNDAEAWIDPSYADD